MADLNGRSCNRTEFVDPCMHHAAGMGRLSGHPAPRQRAAAADTQRLSPVPPATTLRTANSRPSRRLFHAPTQRSVRLLQRNRLWSVMLKSNGNVGVNEVERLETLVQQKVSAIKIFRSKAGTSWEQSGNKKEEENIHILKR